VQPDETSKNPFTSGAPDCSTLATLAMAALYEADLVVEMELLRRRVIARGATVIFEAVADGRGGSELRYKPMVELLLRHVRDVAVSERTRDERREEILWALEMAGF
jgi:hypothetical protein